MLETRIIDHTNKKWFWSYLNTEEEVGEVCEYLQKNNLQIEIKGNFEGGYNGFGQKVMLEGIDLSGNGFCFSGNNLLNHVRYFRKLEEISKTEDFKEWLKMYNYFDIVRRYIIEKDQRWIKSDKLEEIFKA